jgi:hypothetical protein
LVAVTPVTSSLIERWKGWINCPVSSSPLSAVTNPLSEAGRLGSSALARDLAFVRVEVLADPERCLDLADGAREFDVEVARGLAGDREAHRAQPGLDPRLILGRWREALAELRRAQVVVVIRGARRGLLREQPGQWSWFWKPRNAASVTVWLSSAVPTLVACATHFATWPASFVEASAQATPALATKSATTDAVIVNREGFMAAPPLVTIL